MPNQSAKLPNQSTWHMPERLKPISRFINPRVFYTLLSASVIIAGTYLAILYAKGNYRITKQGFIANSGLLNANSFPSGAEVFIDDKLVTATDNTIYLEPGDYDVKITKEGFSPWQKQISIEEQLVAQTNAQLFPTTPSLTPITFTGVENVHPSPDGQKILYYTASASSKTKNGLYVLELSNNFLAAQKSARQVIVDASEFDLSKASFIWSPDSTEVMIFTEKNEFLISLDKKYNLAELADIGLRKKTILAEWEQDMYVRERQFLAKFPTEMVAIATTSAKNVYISPDKKRLMYTATAATTIPDTIVPPIPATNTQIETRVLIPGDIYIYDREEDKNFRIGREDTSKLDALKANAQSVQKVDAKTGKKISTPQETQISELSKKLLAIDLASPQPMTLESSPSAFQTMQASSSAETASRFNIYHTSLYINTLQWFPDSKHVIFVKDNRVQIMEYDGTNNTTLYSGPFAANFIYPWPDGSKLLITTSFSPGSPMNLYAIELK